MLTATPSARQAEILALLAEGLTNAEIGRRLYVTENTVKIHLRRLYVATGARDRPHLVTWGFASGHLTPETYRT